MDGYDGDAISDQEWGAENETRFEDTIAWSSESMTMYDLFTLVVARDSGPEAVPPIVTNQGSEKGMMVYPSQEAASEIASQLYVIYGLHCTAMRLVDYIGHTTGALPWPPE